VRLIERLFQRINGVTMIVVSHDVWSTRRIADHALVLLPGGQVAQGSPDALRQHADPRVRAFMNDEVDPAVVAEAARAVEGPASR